MNNSDLIKKLIADFDLSISEQKDKVKYWDDLYSQKTTEIGNLRLAISHVAEIPEATAVLQEKLIKLENYVNDSVDRFLRDSREKYDALALSRRAFMEVIQNNCEHDFEFESTDYHKREDSYRCKICGKVT